MTLTDASKFPVINHGGTGDDWSWATLFDASNVFEIVKVTRRDNASNVLTIVRGTGMGLSGYTDSDCKAWASTTTGVACRLIAQVVNDIGTATTAAAASAAAAAASAASAVAGVKVTTNDTTADKLDSKISVGAGLSKSVTNPGGNEILNFTVTFPVTTVFGRAGAVVLQGSDVTGALGYTPYNFGANTPYHTGNFDPATKASLNATVTFAGVTCSSIASSGNINIGATTPMVELNSPGVYSFAIRNTASVLYFGNTNGGGTWTANKAYIDSSGNFTAVANVIAYSDERLKRDWQDLPSDFIARLSGVKMGTYDRTDEDIRQVGVGAQSLREVMPEAIIESDDGTLGVAYGNAALAACVALAREVVQLRAELNDLKAKAGV